MRHYNVDKGCRKTRGGTGKPNNGFFPFNIFSIFSNYTNKSDQPLLSDGNLKRLFQQFDRDSDGRLSKEELIAAFNYLGSSLPTFRASSALHRADADGDGFISEEELEAVVKYAAELGFTVQ